MIYAGGEQCGIWSVVDDQWVGMVASVSRQCQSLSLSELCLNGHIADLEFRVVGGINL
jgi:hypothetical protein